MNEEINNTVEVVEEENSAATEEKTFSQNDVNRIVQERLSRERERINGMINEDEGIRQELMESKLKLNAATELSQKGYPHELMELLDYTSEESCKSSLNKVLDVFDRAIKCEVDRIFRVNGREPGRGNTGNSMPPDKLKEAFRP